VHTENDAAQVFVPIHDPTEGALFGQLVVAVVGQQIPLTHVLPATAHVLPVWQSPLEVALFGQPGQQTPLVQTAFATIQGLTVEQEPTDWALLGQVVVVEDGQQIPLMH